MSLALPKWATDVAIVGLIVAMGGYAIHTQNQLTTVQAQLNALQTASGLPNKAPAQAAIAPDASLSEVTALHGLSLENKVDALFRWAEQVDRQKAQVQLEQTRVFANYSNLGTASPTRVAINKAHARGEEFAIGDRLLLKNPINGQSVEVTVERRLNQLKDANILVQMPKTLLPQLGLSSTDGIYEIYAQADPAMAQWQALAELSKTSPLASPAQPAEAITALEDE